MLRKRTGAAYPPMTFVFGVLRSACIRGVINCHATVLTRHNGIVTYYGSTQDNNKLAYMNFVLHIQQQRQHNYKRGCDKSICKTVTIPLVLFRVNLKININEKINGSQRNYSTWHESLATFILRACLHGLVNTVCCQSDIRAHSVHESIRCMCCD